MMHSCVYRGHVRHHRFSPDYRFQYSTSWTYLDLSEVDEILKSRVCFSDTKFAPASFRRADHFGDPQLSMREAVRNFVQQETGLALNGPVRLLTQLRQFGLYFSPINLFYCFDPQESLLAIIAEVGNTPWNERHCYLLWQGNREANSQTRYSHPKEFHVSPFMGMDSQYEWCVVPPDDQLHVSIGCRQEGKTIFHAELNLKRVPLTGVQMARSLLRRPLAAVHILGAIYYQALKLKMKKCQFYPHPNTLIDTEAEQASPSGSASSRSRLPDQI